MEKAYNEFINELTRFYPVLKFYITLSKLLASVSLTEWWKRALALDEEGISRFLKLMPDDNYNYRSKDEFIQAIQTDYINRKSSSEDISNISDRDEKMIKKMLPPNSGLLRFFNGKGKSKYNNQDMCEYLFFHIWLFIRDLQYFKDDVTAEKMNISECAQLIIGLINESGYSSGQFYDDMLDMCRLLKDQSASKELILPKASLFDGPSIIENTSNKQFDFNTIEDHNDEWAYIVCKKLCSSFSDHANFQIQEFQRFIDIFFACLNSDLLGVDSLEIVDQLSKQSFNGYVQQEYDSYCKRHPRLTRNYVFADTVHVVLKNEDLTWNSARSASCFNLPWSTYKIQKLYDSIIDKYIDPKTDIRIFGYLLTGFYPKSITKGEVAKQIAWIDKEKQSAALFLGEMKKRDERGHHLKWSMVPKIFTYMDKDLSFHSSTQYNQALRSGKFEALLQSINDAESFDEIDIEIIRKRESEDY